MPEVIPPWAASLGVGGVLAALMFYFYRMDRKDCAKRHEESSARWEKHSESMSKVVENNTVAHTEVKGAVESLKASLENRQRKYDSSK